MRLIDADKIEYTSIAHLASYPVAPSPCDTVMRAEINAMPTVEAIPVKWLEDRIRLYRDCGNDLRANVIENEIELWRAKNRRGE